MHETDPTRKGEYWGGKRDFRHRKKKAFSLKKKGGLICCPTFLLSQEKEANEGVGSDEKYVLQPTHPLPFILVERLLPYSAKGPYFTSPPSLPLCIPPLPRGIFLFRGGEIPCGETEKKRETRLCEYITSGDGGGGPFPGVTHERCCTFSLECATKMFSQFFMHEKWNIFCEKYGLICV